MQPYFLPYLGYFQLMAHCDRFVLLDDVAYIKRGWINRNRILVGKHEHTFALPVRKASQNRRIMDLDLAVGPEWTKDFLTTVSRSYGKAPRFREIYPGFEELMETLPTNLALAAEASIRWAAGHLGIATEMVRSSQEHPTECLKAQERILDICRRESAATYVNPIGGIELYSGEDFENVGIELKFLRANLRAYPHAAAEFVPGLSILDLLMNCDQEELDRQLASYELLDPQPLSERSWA